MYIYTKRSSKGEVQDWLIDKIALFHPVVMLTVNNNLEVQEKKQTEDLKIIKLSFLTLQIAMA